MIKNIFIITIATTSSLCAMDIPSTEINETIRYEKTHPSVRTLTKNKSFIRKSQHKKRWLKDKLEDKPDNFWMWTPEEGAFHSLYKAKNKNDIIKTLNCCNPDLRMGKHSILSSIMLSPNISFDEKKEIITTLLSQDYTPTNADKKINLLETWERCTEKKIIEKIYLFFWIDDQGIALRQLQQEIVQIMALIAFNTESLL